MTRFTLVIIIVSFLPNLTAYGQSKKKKRKSSPKIEILRGEMNPIDYLDTFKNNAQAQTKIVTIGKLMDSLEIKSLDSGKTLHIKPGQPFTPPPGSHTEGWVNPKTEFSKAFPKSKGIKVEILYKKKDKYYGVLEFNKVYQACAGDPSARSYYINISDVHFNHAKGGNTTVIYEYYVCAPREGDRTVRDYTTSDQKYTSWVLWISDIPFE